MQLIRGDKQNDITILLCHSKSMTKIMWCHENLQDLESVILGLPIACSIFEKSHFRSISFYQFMKTVAPKIGEILARAEQATKSRWQSFEEGILSSKFPHSRVQNLSQEQNFLHRVHVRIYFLGLKSRFPQKIGTVCSNIWTCTKGLKQSNF